MTRQEFSFIAGGPVFRLLRSAHLTDDGLGLVRRRIIVIVMVAWVPLLVLAAMNHQAMPGSVTVPFLLDLEAHFRFLVTLPMLLAAETVVHQRLHAVPQYFVERQLIPQHSTPRFDDIVASAIRLRNSATAEALLIALVYGVGVFVVWRQFISLDVASWYATPSAEGPRSSPAGMWFSFVSLPMFQFLLCRWYYRLFIWIRFLWQVSRLELSLISTHPDRVGGMGFLMTLVYAFSLVAVAHGAMLAGPLANRILFLGEDLRQFQLEVAVVVIFVLAILLGPLVVFGNQLAAARRRGFREYGALAETYVRQFDVKWLRGGAPAGSQILGSPDVQSLADFGNSFSLVRAMRLVPVTYDHLLYFTLFTLAPISPLLLTMMPLEELARSLAGVLFNKTKPGVVFSVVT